jgi:hypothetical protein
MTCGKYSNEILMMSSGVNIRRSPEISPRSSEERPMAGREN